MERDLINDQRDSYRHKHSQRKNDRENGAKYVNRDRDLYAFIVV